MSRRIDIELTSARPDGTWTWRAAGAREPKGVLEGTILPEGAKAGDVLKVDAEFEVEGITVLGVASLAKSRKEPTLLEIIPTERNFEPVTQTLAKRERSDRPRRDGDRDRPRRDGDRRPGGRPEGDRRPGGRPEGGPGRGPRPEGGDKRGGERGGDRRDRPARPRFEPVPELPQRPRPKRLKPGKVHRTAVLADLPEAQRAIAEKALSGGIPAVRQAVNDQNASLRAEGKEEVPAAGLLKMAEELLPRLRVAEWLDRADAARADLDELDLRDLRSVVAAGEDPAVSRDETTRALAAELKAALATKQEKASAEWLEDISLALGVGRVIRALKLSAEPPKAGMRFPAELGTQLVAAAVAALAPDATPDRWSAVLEAVAFSPVRSQVTPASGPTQTSDELTATVTRLAALVPQIAALFGIAAAPGSSAPKPLRPTRPKPDRKPGSPAGPGGRPGGPRPGAPAGAKPDRAGAAPTQTPSATSTDAPSVAPPAEGAPTQGASTEGAPAEEAAPVALEPAILEPAADSGPAETAAPEPPAAAEPPAASETAPAPPAEVTEPAADAVPDTVAAAVAPEVAVDGAGAPATEA